MPTTSDPATLFAFRPVGADNGFSMPDYWVWCPSIIRGPDGMYHMFASRWPKTLPFHPGWLTNSEIVRAVAERAEGPYQFMEVILARRGPEFWDGSVTHNSTIRSYKGRYYLYYMGNNIPFPAPAPGENLALDDPRVIVARSRKRIGVAWADSLEGPWHRAERPILDVKPGTFYSFLTSNPAPWIDPESGRVAMIFKARAYEGDRHGAMTLGLAAADHPEDTYQVVGDEPLLHDGLFGELEDPFLWRQGGAFHLVAKDMQGTAAGQPGAAVYAVSPDLQSWQKGSPGVAWRKSIPCQDGCHIRCGSMERPFLFGDGDRFTHLCVAASDGREGFTDAKRTWNAVLPLLDS